MSSSTDVQNPPKRTWWRYLLTGGLLLAGLILVGPWLLAKTPLRNVLLGALVNNPALTVTSQSASFGYLSPLRLSGLNIQDVDDRLRVDVAEIATDRSWFSLLLSRPQLGTVTVDHPEIDVLVEPKTDENTDEAAESPESPSPPVGLLPVVTAQIRDAAIRVRTPQHTDPVIDLQQLNVTFRAERDPQGSLLVIDPVLVFDHQPLTPELCDSGLQLVAPLLAGAVTARGDVSFDLQAFQIPIGSEDLSARQNSIQIRGQVQLHSASLGLKQGLTRNVLRLVFQLLKEDLPQELTLAQDVAVDFEVREGRVFHEGLAFVFPHRDSSITLTSQGSVGLDETLDLELTLQLPEGLLGDSPLAARLAGRPISLAVTGTFDQPQIGLPGDTSLTQTLTKLLTSEDSPLADEELADQLQQLVGGLLQRAAERRQNRDAADEAEGEGGSLIPDLLNRLQDRRNQRRERRNR